MYALVDCNSFFCSVERVFHPGLHNSPVCVLSSNDGCIVALTPEAKKVGLRRGDPLFKVIDIVRNNNVRVFSGNIRLYAAMSKRVVSILRHSVHHVENYSIDDSFCDLRGYETHCDLETMMRSIANRIVQWTDIPVSVGVAPTKTLAKMGSKFAKTYPGYRSVCMIDTDDKRRKALSMFALDDVWGIGRHTLNRLTYYGIHTPLQFADKSETWVRTHLHKPGVQTWLELNGTDCIDTAERLRHQTICTSRSFGTKISDLASLQSSVATFASSCAGKLRSQHSVASAVTVFLCAGCAYESNESDSNVAEPDESVSNMATTTLIVPTSDTIEITAAALRALVAIYRPGACYRKSGVILGSITSATSVQTDLFDTIGCRPQRSCLMNAIDSINLRYGPMTVHLGIADDRLQQWRAKGEYRSPDYLTDINQIPVIHI